MAIRLGSNAFTSEKLTSADLNDTFAAVTINLFQSETVPTTVKNCDYWYIPSSNTLLIYIAGSFFTYINKSFSVATQEGTPAGLFFSGDGTKMYIVGEGNNVVYQYSLSTSWDVSTASYANKSFSVAGQAANSSGLSFSSDGTKMYIVEYNTGKVYQYSLSTAWDVSTASYANKSFSVVGQDGTPRGLFFSSDGTKMYISGFITDKIYQYSLSTAWDVSTASYTNKSFSVITQAENPKGLFFSGDGTKMYVISGISPKVCQYSLSTAWDVSTASYSNKYLDISTQTNSPTDLFISNDGIKMYVVGYDYDKVYQYALDYILLH